MNKTFLTAVSVLALTVAGPAFADMSVTSKTKASVSPGSQEAADRSTGSVTKDIENAWENTKKDMSKATENVSEAVEDTYDEAKTVIEDNDDEADVQSVNVGSRMSAETLIGKPVLNTENERIAKIHDIILDQNGHAQMVILADGDFTGLGKLVAFDYDIITQQGPDGYIVAPVSEEMINQASSFSYDPEDATTDVRVIPSNGYSVSELLDSEVVDPKGESVASVDNIVFDNGQAEQLVVSVGQTLGMGGKQAAISYNDFDMSRDGEKVHFKLSANESIQLRQYGESSAK